MAILIPSSARISICGMYLFLTESCPLPGVRAEPHRVVGSAAISAAPGGASRSLKLVHTTHDPSQGGMLRRLHTFRVVGPRVLKNEVVSIAATQSLSSDGTHQTIGNWTISTVTGAVLNESYVDTLGRLVQDAVQQEIYIDPQGGLDTNAGTIGFPVRTMQRAYDLWNRSLVVGLYRKRGSTFTDDAIRIRVSGPSSSNKCIVGTYGTGADPVHVGTSAGDAPEAPFQFKGSADVNNWIVAEALLVYSGTSSKNIVQINSSSAGGLIFYQLRARRTDNIDAQGASAFWIDPIDNPAAFVVRPRFYRCGAFDVSGYHGHGFYANHTLDYDMSDCRLDHCGYDRQGPNPAIGRPKTEDHTHYNQDGTTCFIYNSVITRSGGNGLSCNLGAIVADCVVHDANCGIVVRGHPLSGVGNCFISGGHDSINSNDGSTNYGGTGIEVQKAWSEGNTPANMKASAPCYLWNNIIAHKDPACVGAGAAINIKKSSENRDIVVFENKIAWRDMALQFADGGAPGNDLYWVRDNKVNISLSGTGENKCVNCIPDSLPISTMRFARNVWYSVAGIRFFPAGGGGSMTNAQWTSQVEADAVYSPAPAFPNPTRSLEAYLQTVGYANLNAYFAAIRTMSAANWDQNTSGAAAMDWLQGGFTVQGSNAPPIANAGVNASYTLPSGSSSMDFTLDGSQSIDPDGTIVAFRWTDATGVLVATISNPSLNRGVGSHAFSLQVQDENGLWSDPSTVLISIVVDAPVYHPPVANAGANIIAFLAPDATVAEVELDGSGTTDPDNDIASLGWFNGATQVATGLMPTIFVPLTPEEGLELRLIATDAQGLSSSDTVRIFVYPTLVDQPPVAVAGPDIDVVADANGAADVQLDGSGSSDGDGIIALMTWFDDAAQLEVAVGVRPFIRVPVTPPEGKVYTLRVTDDDGLEAWDEVNVRVRSTDVPTPPLVDAGPDQEKVDVTDSGVNRFSLDATVVDAHPETVSFSWVRYSPSPSSLGAAVLPLSTSKSFSMDVPVNMTLDLQVTARNSGGLTATDRVKLISKPLPATLRQKLFGWVPTIFGGPKKIIR